MILNLQIDVDWLEEDMTLDESVKESIISSVVDKIEEKVESQIKEQVDNEIDEAVFDKINEKTESVFNDFINRSVTITDRYGDSLKTYNNLHDLIKERFDKFLNEMVDEDGKTARGSFGSKYSRIYYIVDKQIKNYADEFTKSAVGQVRDEIKDHVKNGLTEKLGKELMKVLKVEEMLSLEENNKKRK